MTLVDVALPYRLPRLLTYEFKGFPNAEPGCRLLVPLGRRQVVGCLLEHSSKPAPAGLKPVTDLLDETPLLTPLQIKLLSFASSYYLTPIGEVLRHLIPPSYFRPNGKTRPGKPLPDHSAFSPGGAIVPNEEQSKAIQEILAKPRGPYLLEGITGSGKTEVYIDLARQLLAKGGQILVLVPEIALTPQLVGRFEAALSGTVLPYHSGLTEAQKLLVWNRSREEGPLLVIGTRSAVFLPLPRLALVVVDEEHDPSYKQNERFCYHARDLALWRGKTEKIPVVLGSATPSLESLARAEQGKMSRLRLTARPTGATLPETILIDRRDPENRRHFLSDALRQSLVENLRRGEQSLLFLNRRGFAPFLICPLCGYIPRCPSCEISLTYHKRKLHLVCHYCDQSKEVPSLCPQCSQGPLLPEGIGTQRIEEELAALFPRARIARLDRDTSSPENLRKVLGLMRQGDLDILIGTQTVAKGHDFPLLTLVGIIDADTALNLPDFRASERCYQLLTQVAGRAGRADRPGRVIVQTYHPEHPSLVASLQQRGDLFYRAELQNREASLYPPFARLVRLVLYGRRPSIVERVSGSLHRRLLAAGLAGARILGPAPCPLARLRQNSRWHLLIKCREFARIHPILQTVLDDFSQDDLPSTVRMLVDVDPVEMM